MPPRNTLFSVFLIFVLFGLTSGHPIAKAQSDPPLTIQTFVIHHLPVNDMLPMVREFLSPSGRAVGDPRTNQIIVSDTHRHLETIGVLIDRLDRRQANVRVEARLVEAERSFLHRLGLQWDAAGRIRIGDLDLILQGGYFFYPLDEGLNARVRVVLQESAAGARSLSSSSLLTLSGSRARLEVGSRVPIPVRGRHGRSLTVYRDVLFALSILPRVLPDDHIQLNIALSEEELGTGLTIDRSAVDTVITVAPGQMVVIGGIDTSRVQHEEHSIPGLSDLPLLGRFFDDRTRTDKEMSLVLLVQCRSVD